jgi:GNAT superfamily N-acetyltransferase
MIERDVVVDAIEGSLFSLPEMPGYNWILSVPGIEGHHTTIASPELNLVGRARLTAENVDATIAVVQDIFRREGKLVGWLVTPRSMPPDLPRHLLDAGFVLAEEAAGMALMDMQRAIPTNPDVRIERLDSMEDADLGSLFVRAYGFPTEAAGAVAAFFTALADHMKFWLYVAHLPGSDEPVAFAASLFPPNSPLVVLQGAGTLPEHRGRGIYSTMVARRLRDAHAEGAQAAAIQANRATSAPIAARLGFEELLPMTIYAWQPEADG